MQTTDGEDLHEDSLIYLRFIAPTLRYSPKAGSTFKQRAATFGANLREQIDPPDVRRSKLDHSLVTPRRSSLIVLMFAADSDQPPFTSSQSSEECSRLLRGIEMSLTIRLSHSISAHHNEV
jgi:hypothetical protein